MSKLSDQHRIQLLQLIANGAFHSGEALGETLGLSRAAISNHIKALSALGLDIFSVKGKGYRLAAPLSLLQAEQILALRRRPAVGALDVLNIIDSTNQHVKSRTAELASGYACVAEAQTAGRGRHGRTWVSPYGASIYLSYFWSFAQGYQAMAGLSLAIGVAISEALRELGFADIQLKWPNDIYLNSKKLAGVLIEVEGQVGSACDSIIGIGLNVALPSSLEGIDQPFTDLASVADQQVDRNQLVAVLLDQLDHTLQLFEQQGLPAFSSAWQQLDLFRNKPVKLILGDQTVRGMGRGINDSGAFLLEHEGQIKAYHGGEISVRADD